MNTWDSLTSEQQDASGKGYNQPTPRDLVDDEDNFELRSTMDMWDDDQPDDIGEWLELMADFHERGGL